MENGMVGLRARSFAPLNYGCAEDDASFDLIEPLHIRDNMVPRPGILASAAP